MYFRLLKAVKDRLIWEVKAAFADHPKYKKIVDNVQGRFAMDEAPQFGAVVSNTGGTPMRLSADNFVGTIMSHTMLASPHDKPGTSVEWVREDLLSIHRNSDVFPTLPGVYLLTMTGSFSDGNGTFVVDPFIHVPREPLIRFVTGQEPNVTLVNTPLQGSLRLVLNDHMPLVETTEYTVDYGTGQITFVKDFRAGETIWAEYVYPSAQTGPFNWEKDRANTAALPGAILAFGNRVQDGDQMAVVITQGRTPTHKAYGGRWEVSYDISLIARDPIQFEEMADYLMVVLFGPRRDALSFDGIEITNLSFTGEGEEVYDETGDDQYYVGSLSLDIQTDWSIHVPILSKIRAVEFVNQAQAVVIAGAAEVDVPNIATAINLMRSLGVVQPVQVIFPGKGAVLQDIH